MPRPRSRLLAPLVVVALTAPRPAFAQPVSFQLKNDVAFPARPTLNLTAAEKVSDIRLELLRDDGTQFEARHGSLGPGQKAALSIGDGKPGRVHWKGKIRTMMSNGAWWSYDLSFETVVRAEMSLKYDVEHLDLPGRVLRFQQTRPAGKADVTVIGDDGNPIGRGAVTFHGEAPGTWLAVPWTQERPGRVLVIKLHAVAADGLAAATELTPWSVEIEHDEVSFDTDSAVIKPAEGAKLDASYARILDAKKYAERFIKVKLYIAGHTDTVGSKDHNRQLSVDRARAIAEYFRRKGLKAAMAYEGFGEEVPRVITPDNVDEPRNRRVDYVLGAAEMAPPFKGSYSGVRADWKSLR